MSIVSTLFEITKFGLSIADTKLKNKYIDKVISLEKKYYAEYNKSDETRRNNVLDNIEHELCIIANSIATFRKSNS